MNTLMEHECPCCGAKVEFDSASQKLKCPYCDTTFDVSAMKDRDRELDSQNQTPPEDLDWQMEKQQWLDEEKQGLKVYGCKSCGGEIIADSTTAASHCPYCGNPVIMTGNLADDLKPDGVLPFQVNKAMAMNALKNHMTGKKLLAKSFITDNMLEEIKGVYVPFWLFDAQASGEVRYHATKVRSWRTSQHICTETNHYDVVRAGSLGFRQIPVDGGSKIPDDLMESVEPFDFSKVMPFQTAYLSGYFADRYDVSSQDTRARASERAKKTILDSFDQTVTGYNSIKAESTSIHLENPKAKYVLCPVWLLTVRYGEQTYLFAVNGQTGRIAGNMPVDEKAASNHRLGYTLAIGGVMALLSILFFGLNLITIAGSFLIGWFISDNLVENMKKEVQAVEFQTGAANYADTGGLSLSKRQDRFLYANVTRTPIPKNAPPGGGVHQMPPVSGVNRNSGSVNRPMGGLGGVSRPGTTSRPGGVGKPTGVSRPIGGIGSGSRSGGAGRPSGGMGRPGGVSRSGTTSRPGGVGKPTGVSRPTGGIGSGSRSGTNRGPAGGMGRPGANRGPAGGLGGGTRPGGIKPRGGPGKR